MIDSYVKKRRGIGRNKPFHYWGRCREDIYNFTQIYGTEGM